MDEGRAYYIHTLCRICLNHLENDAAYGLFLVSGLAKKLCVCTSLSVELDDGFPENICTSCFSKLDDLHNFQKMCVDSVQKFNDMVASNCFDYNTPSMNCVNVLNVATHDTDIAEEEYDCNFDPCLNTKIEIVESEDHLLDNSENEDKEFQVEDKSSSIHSDGDVDDGNVDFEVSSSESEQDMVLSQLRNSAISKAKQKAEKSTHKDETDDSSGDDNDKGSTKVKRISVPERYRHTLIECHVCNQKFKEAFRYEEHMKHHNDLLPFQCEVETCKKSFTTNGGLRLHMEHAHPELVKAYPCTVEGCDRTFTRTHKLTNHLKNVHSIVKPKIKEFPCPECDKVFQCPTALKKHMYKHTGEEFPNACEHCGKRFFIQAELRDHLLRHAGIKNYECPHCGIGKYTQSELNKHVAIHNRVKQFHCSQCNHSSYSKHALNNHVKVVHLKIKKHVCQQCGKTFGKPYSLRAHQARHTNEKAYVCNICGISYAAKKSLVRHLQTHENSETTEEEPTTTIEDQQLTPLADDNKPKLMISPQPQSSNKLQHVDVPQLTGAVGSPVSFLSIGATKIGDKFICPGCGRGFNHKSNMKIHYRNIHEKVKDQACRFCPKRFAVVQTLRNHELIHTGEKPFDCNICGKAFRQKLNLQTHLKTHNKPPKAPKKENTNVSPNFEENKVPAADIATSSATMDGEEMIENDIKIKIENEA
ncbi:CG17328 [Drosophila busckii]|uniref:CG17328 n=1 Tax=Drosophila busckii TaxID=30019 RepID=A0A0M3QWP4_DROBS|nr:zinc finger protein 714-like [Drosophila busckii]ALC44503.1 CG17328 [Drosophila busckii]